MRIANIIVTIVLLASSVSAQPLRHDGNWWKDLRRPLKIEYAVGFFDGMKLGFHFTYWKTESESPQDECLGKASESQTQYWSTYARNVSPDQLADGLDALYKDYRNRKIQLQWGVWIVMKQIAGTPKAEIDELIETSRKAASKYTFE